MTTDRVSGKAAQLRSLLIRAWRERWTASQYGTQVKAVLGRGVSGDVYGLAEALLGQALTGPAPNQLLLSLLSHSLAAQLVSHAAALQAIAKFTSYSRPHCTAALLQLLLPHRSFITCRSPRPEECLALATALVSGTTWILNTTASTIQRLVELRDSPVDTANLSTCHQLLQWLLTDPFASCLLTVGREEDAEQATDLAAAALLVLSACDQLYTFLPESGSTLERDLRATVRQLKVLDPAPPRPDGPASAPLFYTIHSVISYEAVLCPTSDLTRLASHLATILSLRGAPLPALLTEVVRCCLLAMNEHDGSSSAVGFEVLKWDAFTLIKLPRLFGLLASQCPGGREPGLLHAALTGLLQHAALLDTTDARCKANCFELVVESMRSLLSETEMEELNAARRVQLKKREGLDLKPPIDLQSRDVNLTIKADKTLDTILKTFENRSTDQNDFDNLLSVMYHIIKGSSFDLLLSASAANGTLHSLVTKLLFFNHGCCESQGESVKVSQNRAALFDMTFLMLVYMVQCFGSEVILRGAQTSFFSQWAKQCMVEPGAVKPLGNFTAQESLVDSLLQQFTQGEVRTQVVKWNSVCSSVHGVMSEMLLAAELGAVSKEHFRKLTGRLYSQLCCFPVCIVSWIASHTHYGDGGREGGPGGWRGGEDRVTPFHVIDTFLEAAAETETDGESLQFFPNRCNMMVTIVRRMKVELVRGGLAVPGAEAGQGWAGSPRAGQALEEELTELWTDTWRRGRLDIAGTRRVARLLQVGGPEWLVRAALEQLGRQVYGEDVERATELVFSLLHIDLAACTLALLATVLPRLLAAPEGREGLLAFPTGRALARLTVRCLGAALAQPATAQPYLPCPGRPGALERLLAAGGRPGKLRRGAGGEPHAAQEQALPTQESLLEEAHKGLFGLLSLLGQDPVLSPRLEFLSSLLEEAVAAGRDTARAVLHPLPAALVMQLVKVQPDRFSLPLLANLFDPSSREGRKTGARLLCLARNLRAARRAEEPEG